MEVASPTTVFCWRSKQRCPLGEGPGRGFQCVVRDEAGADERQPPVISPNGGVEQSCHADARCAYNVISAISVYIQNYRLAHAALVILRRAIQRYTARSMRIARLPELRVSSTPTSILPSRLKSPVKIDVLVISLTGGMV